MKYLKKFQTTSDYNTYINGNDAVLPNVSMCGDNEVHYNPIVPPSRVIVATLNIETTSNPTVLCYENGWTDVESVLVTRPNGTTFELSYEDLVQYDPYSEFNDPFMGYQFDVTGIHTIEYTLKENITELNNNGDMFANCYSLISVEIPNCITSIGSLFNFCIQLTTVIIPNTVTSFGLNSSVFWDCSSLSSLTMLSTTPPTSHGIIDSGGNLSIPNIYVPSASVDAYKTAEEWSYFANKIFAIPTN